VFSDHFDALISKMIFKNKKNIILMHFQMKNTLKNNRNYTPKRDLTLYWTTQPSKVVKNIFLTRHEKYKINSNRKNGS
jgi:hypothetical protein